MRATGGRVALAIALASGLWAPPVVAEEGAKALPTLLIKGEVVSLDATDPAATLLKVKDRYGFETPIYLTQETQILQGDQALAASNLSAGAGVEVEYNFDINTAKRHAVRVSLSAAPAPTAAGASAAAPEASAPAPTAVGASAAAPAAASSEAVPAASSGESAATTTADTSQDQSGASVQ